MAARRAASDSVDRDSRPASRYHIHQRVQRRRTRDPGRGGRPTQGGRGGCLGVFGEANEGRCRPFRRDVRQLLPRGRVPGRDEPKPVVPIHPYGDAVTNYRKLAWSDVIVPTALAEVVDEISYQRVVMNPGATWVFFTGPYAP